MTANRTAADLLAKAAEKIRSESRKQQAESQVGRAPEVPYARYDLAELCDELSRAVTRDELPSQVRELSIRFAEETIGERTTP